jgi:hypothetical protein
METRAVLLLSVLTALSLVCVAVVGLFRRGIRERVAGLHGGYPTWVLREAGFVATGALAAYFLFPAYRSGAGYAGICAALVGAGWLLCAHAYAETAAAVEVIRHHPWLRSAEGEGLRERIRHARNVYPDWKYLINTHYVPWKHLSWGGFLLTAGGVMTFAFDGVGVGLLAGTSLLFGLVSVFVLSVTLRGYKTYSGSIVRASKPDPERRHSYQTRSGGVVTVEEKDITHPELVDALVGRAERSGEAVVPPVDPDNPVYGPGTEHETVPEDRALDYPTDRQESEARWATGIFGLLEGYMRVTRVVRAYLPPTWGFSLAYGVAALLLMVVFFGVTVSLLPVAERFGVSEQTVAVYFAVWVVVAFCVFVPGVYVLSRTKGDEDG